VRLPMTVIVVTAGDVVEVAVVASALTNRVDRRVDKTKSQAAIGHGLLIDQREKSGPARCREAGASPASRARALVAKVVVEITFRRHVRDIAYRCGSSIARVGHPCLPARNGEAIVGGAAAAVCPRCFRLPGATGAIRG